MKKLFATISGAFGAIPGLAVLMYGLGAPPGEWKLFGGVTESFGTLTLIILYVNKGKLGQISLRRLTNWAIALGCISFGGIGLYIALHEICIVHCALWGSVLYPLWLSGELAKVVAEHGGREQALCDYGAIEIVKAMSPVVRGITIYFLLLVYTAISVCLAAAFGLLAVRHNEPPSVRCPEPRLE